MRAVDQVNQAIAQMDQVTQQNAALVKEAAAAADSMQEQAKQLSSVVGTFKLATGAAPAHPRADHRARASATRATPARALLQ